MGRGKCETVRQGPVLFLGQRRPRPGVQAGAQAGGCWRAARSAWRTAAGCVPAATRLGHQYVKRAPNRARQAQQRGLSQAQRVHVGHVVQHLFLYIIFVGGRGAVNRCGVAGMPALSEREEATMGGDRSKAAAGGAWQQRQQYRSRQRRSGGRSGVARPLPPPPCGGQSALTAKTNPTPKAKKSPQRCVFQYSTSVGTQGFGVVGACVKRCGCSPPLQHACPGEGLHNQLQSYATILLPPLFPCPYQHGQQRQRIKRQHARAGAGHALVQRQRRKHAACQA